MADRMNVRDLTDNASVRWLHLQVLGMCFLTNVVDGLDTQIIGFTGPLMAPDLGVSMPAFAAVFSAGTFGVLLGAIIMGRLGDRLGRRNSLIACTVFIGLFTLATPFARNLTELIAIRFIGSLALGGAMPLFLTLVAEYAPKSRKAFATGLLWSGYPIGGVIGGVTGSLLIVEHGWELMYYIGGGLALAVAVLQWFLLPESLQFLALKSERQERIRQIARRIAPRTDFSTTTFIPDVQTGERAGMAQVFAGGRGLTTVMLWLPLFFTFVVTKFTILWTPTLFEQAGMEIQIAALMVAVGNLASVPSMAVAGYLLDRTGPGRVLPFAYGGVAIALAALAFFVEFEQVVVIAMIVIGFLQGPCIAGMLYLATAVYPAQVRSTGVGLAMGIGRTGQVFVASVVGAVMAIGVGPEGVILLMCVAPIISLLSVLALSRQLRSRGVHVGGNRAVPHAAE